MRDVIPMGSTRDSEFLFARMTERTLLGTRAGPGQRILDVAAGLGQDAAALAARGALAVAAEPSSRMIGLAKVVAAQRAGAPVELGPAERSPIWVRAWSDALPFAPASF